MSSRKFLDITGLSTLVNNIKTLLAGKQDTLTQGSNITISGNTISATDTTYDNATASVAGLMSAADKTKLDNTFKELSGSQVKIWDLEEGTYKTPENFSVFYQGKSGSAFFTIKTSGYLFVTKFSTTYKEFILFAGASGSSYNLYTGYSSETTGFGKSFSLGQSFLTTNQVKNNLTYSTSNVNYVLSAYQGYVLNQNKADKTEIPTTTSQLTNDSGFISSTDGEVIKQLADGNINIWTLDSGIYSLPTTGYIYYDPDDNTKRVQIGSGGLLLIDKQDNYVNKYVLYMNRIIMYGMTDTIGGMSTATINTCQSIQNKVTSMSSSSTDTQYPSAKAVYNALQLKANHDNVAKDFWYGTQAEYDALTTKDPTTIYITDGIDQGYVYSTTEQRIGTWIDGKPLYQKVFSTTSPTASDQYTDIDVTSLNIATLVKMEGLINAGSDYRQLPLFDRVSNNFYWTDLWYSNNDKLLSVRNTNTSMQNKPCNVIIQYTKTTD